jgi:hypothetical protein
MQASRGRTSIFRYLKLFLTLICHSRGCATVPVA